MWADNETTEDFLNYEVHCNLISEYVTNPNLLPLTIGVFGDWGSGKSSIMKMLEKKLESEDKVLTIYFNSWLFESYEDAKISLLENILLELSKNKTLDETSKKRVLSLISRVDYMKLAKDGIKKYGKNVVDIIATGGVGTAIEAGFSMLNEDKLKGLETADISKLNEYIKDEQKNTTKNTIKSFRKDFEELITLTNYESVVIFVDDLDRCMPERVIETLEAIKLFLSVPNTAFIIGADERIIKHSISMHLKLHTFNNDSEYLQSSQQIVTDYIEKLIQIPYRIPKLSPPEIESYNNLLFCLNLLSSEEFKKIFEYYKEFKKDNIYEPYTLGHIKEIIDIESNPKLNALLHISHMMSLMITNVLKGNPRQTKRFLNTFVLRKKLAIVANLSIEDFILIKLMLLEYFNTTLFNKLNALQSSNQGIVKELLILESHIIDGSELQDIEHIKEWQTDQIKEWLQIEPRLGEVDLRDYFWLARDKTGSTLSGVHMVKPYIRQAYEGLITNKKPITRSIMESIKSYDSTEIYELIDLFESNINNIQNIKSQLEGLHNLIMDINDIEFYKRYLNLIKQIPHFKIEKMPTIPERLHQVGLKKPKLDMYINSILESYTSKEKCLLQISAKKIIEKRGK